MEYGPLKVSCRNCHAKLDISDLEPYTTFPCPECGVIIRVPERFDRYLLEKICGKGGMAKIYRALDTKLARRVAVKILDPEYATGRNFFDSARIVARINHPAVVPVLDCGVFNDRPFLVMKYMDCGDLERHLKADTLPDLPALAGYLAFIASGLAAAAKENIVHHDVKPSNILLSSADGVKLGDFDLADIRKPGDVYTPCEEMGSPGYLSPERLYSGGEDSRGDVFSLGVSIYELFSGRLPFGLNGEPEELYRRRQDMEFEELASVAPMVPPRLSDLVTAMLSFRMDMRPEYPEIVERLSEFSGTVVLKNDGEPPAAEKQE
ncbi:MAG: protein kinase [Lentisphaeria bacterium]|nr:protein kinase [Lentisphaeria bacterium]